MKATLIAILMILTVGCADNKTLDVPNKGVMEVETYGLFNETELREECVNYSLSMGNVIWGIILIESVVVPIYMYGFSLWEPVSIKQECLDKENE